MSESMPRESALPQRIIDDFESALARLDSAPSFTKYTHQGQLISRAPRLLRSELGIASLFQFAHRFDAAGVFLGSDWADPASLEPALAGSTLRGGGTSATLECLSELRLLAVAEGRCTTEHMSAEAARRFLSEVLAANLDLLFPVATESSREQKSAEYERVQALFAFFLDHLGSAAILDELIAEIERTMAQRPIMIQRVEALLKAAERALDNGHEQPPAARIARHWIGALNGPSMLSQAHPDASYAAALAQCDPDYLAAEAGVFGASMNETGLVSAAHARLLRHLADTAPDLLGNALGLDDVGKAGIEAHEADIAEIIRFAIVPQTARAIYGLARLLNAGRLFTRPLLPGLRRLMQLEMHPQVAADLEAASEWSAPPSANVLLLAGTLSVIGQPRGLDQGHNPTCQAARAISLWAQNDVGYLLELIAFAARENDLVMDFEGQPIRASQLDSGMARTLHTELDTVSVLLTPHIDRIYVEMGRRTIGRPGDGHRWVNAEMHGWWVNRDSAELIDIAQGAIAGFDTFMRLFYASYHPAFNGGRDLVYAQPCGIAATDATGTYIGWHAIAIQRIARDSEGQWRVYFFNPNRDKRQNWGQGIETSVHEADELEGESSLPFEQFASRLYLFHYKADETGDPMAVEAEAIARIRSIVAAGWGTRFAWID
ncbi:hypothetical protein V5738_06575 [Salinisphaera sp. SPP-AMP-43]|uniref:hypothetical protein n=1 Tax=Salinisphaera sp. SPP-AMP-43 TaxID=3121288 RepID=UPI003C6E5294